MQQTSMTVEIQALMDHSGWVQELAHKLVADPNVADDLAQETMLAALRGGTSPVRSSKAWLGAVLKNLLWQRVRGERRRRSRELRAAREEGVPSSAQLVERMSAHREVVNVVMSLPEHYRIVLLRRYFEGETPTEIAARTGIPISTVKTRLGRALDLMRQRLDAVHGEDGRGWMVALVPLLGDRTVGPPPVPIRALVVGTSCVIMAAAVVLAWPGLVGSSPAGLSPVPAVASANPLGSTGGNLSPTTMGNGRTAIEVTSEVLGPNMADLMAAPRPLHGRVFDAQGGALAGAVLTFTPLSGRVSKGTPIGISQIGGGFEIPGAVGTGLVKAAGSELVTVVAGMAIGNRRDGLSVVVAPRQILTGIVTDNHGRPLADARIDLELPPGFAGRFGEVMQHAQSLRHTARSDAQGRFAMEHLPLVSGSLIVRREGFLRARTDQPNASEAEVRIALDQPEMAPSMVQGHVLGPGGSPLPDVRVSCGLEVTRTDQAGHFLLDVSETSAGLAGTRLIAAKTGYLPAFVDATVQPGMEIPVWPESIEMHLGAEPLVISGRVLSPGGRGLVGMKVWISDPTVFSHSPRIPGRGYETSRYASSELDYPDNPEVLESYLAGQPDRPWNHVRTDAEGAFEIPGLADRSYTLVAMDPETLVRVESDPVSAGSAAVLTLDTSDVQDVNGRVVDRAGRPVAGIAVLLQRAAFSLRFENSVIQQTSASCASTVTGLDGSFAFYGVSGDGTALRLGGVGIVPQYHPLDAEISMEIIVSRHMHLQVHSGSLQDGQIGVQDENGDELAIHVIQGSQRQVMRRADLVEGRSAVLSVPDHSHTLVLYDGETVRKRLPLQLAPGRVNQIRF